MVSWEQNRLELRYEDDEVDDGIDNDGDGVVDEGVLVLIQDWMGPTEQEVVLCHGVREFLEGETPNMLDDNGNGLIDERGFSVDLDGENLTFRLSLERVDASGNTVIRTLESSVWLRN